MSQTIVNPVFDRTDHPELHVDKIEVYKDSTLIHCTLSMEANTWANISPDTYIEDISTNQKYKIIRSDGIPFSPAVRNFVSSIESKVTFVFPPVSRASKINLIENPEKEAFNIYGISFAESFEKTYRETGLSLITTKASFYETAGDTTQAIKYRREAIDATKYLYGISSDELISAYYTISVLYEKYGHYDLVIDLAERIFGSLNNNSLGYADLLSVLAWAYWKKYDYDRPIQLLIPALEIYEKKKDWISMADVYGTISQNYLWVAKLDSAEQYIKKAINVLNSHCDAEEYLMNEIERTGNNSINIQNHLAAIKLNIDTTKAYILQTLASIYQAQGKYADAISTELEEGRIIESMNDDQLYASHLGALSRYYMIDKQYSKAIECAEQLLILLKNEDKETVLTMLQLASIYTEMGNINKAIQYANKSVLISKSTNNNETAVSANSFLSFLYYINHDYEQLEKTSSETIESLKNRFFNKHVKMTNEQKKSIWKEYGGIFNVYNSIIKNKAINGSLTAKVYDNVLFTKAISIEVSKQETSPVYSQFFWSDIQKHLSNDDIAIEFVCVPEISYPIEQNKNENNSDTSYYALVIDNICQYPKLIPLCGDSKIDKLWLCFRNNDTDSAQCLAREYIWNPILSQFKHAKNIYFCPDGFLHLLPIENIIEDVDNLVDSNYNVYRLSSTKKILDKHQKPHYNSAVLFGDLDYNHFKAQLKKEDKEDSFSFVRGIIDRGGFEPLFNSKDELNEIADILKSKNVMAKLYMGENGTEDCFTQLSDESVNIIHLATHGLYVNPVKAENIKTENNFDFMGLIPNKRSIWDTINWEDISMTHSLLVMAGGNRLVQRENISKEVNDGILTAKEISQMSFQGLELVVLSACETALSDIDFNGISGLQRGFKQAGANTILMSLDKVDDEATKILMVEFYKNLMLGKSKLQSLKAAQKHLREYENGKYSNPKYWASFIMLDGLN